MPRHMGRVLIAVVLVVLVASLAYAGAIRRGGSERGRGGASREERRQQMAERLKLTPSEQQAVTKAMGQKQEAARPLMEQMAKLRRVVEAPKASEAEYRRATADYLAVRDRTERRLEQIDRGLMKQLSPRGQANLLAMGMIDNGFHSMMGMGGMRGGGMMRGGGRGEGGVMGGGMMHGGERDHR